MRPARTLTCTSPTQTCRRPPSPGRWGSRSGTCTRSSHGTPQRWDGSFVSADSNGVLRTSAPSPTERWRAYPWLGASTTPPTSAGASGRRSAYPPVNGGRKRPIVAGTGFGGRAILSRPAGVERSDGPARLRSRNPPWSPTIPAPPSLVWEAESGLGPAESGSDHPGTSCVDRARCAGARAAGVPGFRGGVTELGCTTALVAQAGLDKPRRLLPARARDACQLSVFGVSKRPLRAAGDPPAPPVGESDRATAKSFPRRIARELAAGTDAARDPAQHCSRANHG